MCFIEVRWFEKFCLLGDYFSEFDILFALLMEDCYLSMQTKDYVCLVL